MSNNDNETLPLNENLNSASYTSDINTSSSSSSSSSLNRNHNQTTGIENINKEDSAFICNICLEITHKDPVVTQCGHLYCWSCLFRWLNTQHTTCPVCKAGVSKENVIPLFIRGSEQDPRTHQPHSNDSSVPNRPVGRRPEPGNPLQIGNNNNNLQFGGMSFSVGLGFFPSLFGLQFQSFVPIQDIPRDRNLTQDDIEQAYLSKVIMFLGFLVIFGLFCF
jgi:E3 ubiquitin-protein ligase RNF5